MGATGKGIYEDVREVYNVVAFSDYNPKMWQTMVNGVPVIPPSELANINFDRLILGSAFFDEPAINNLVEMFGIQRSKIDASYISPHSKIMYPTTSRNIFIQYQSKLLNEAGVLGSIAEGGVYQGNFSKLLNEYFPDRKLHLFDTFEGFDERDIAIEQENNFSPDEYKSGSFKVTGFTVDDLLAKMPHPENVIVHKGFFPETANGVDEDFAFVNLDFDLYAPTLAGLEFFYPKLVQGGIILIHDYFTGYDFNITRVFAGPGQAVREFCAKNKLRYYAIGDSISVMIVKG
jgi:hypothetical protein